MKQAAPMSARPESGRGSGAATPFFRADHPVQARLRVSRPGDHHEREADHAADAVVYRRGPMATGGAVARRITPLSAQSGQETAQGAAERASDPSYSEHEPLHGHSRTTVEDEPLQMQGEPSTGIPAAAVQRQEASSARADDGATVMREAATAKAADDETPVQTRTEAQADGPSARAVREEVVQRQLRASRGKGNPLPEPVRQRMQAGMGADFTGVRIHTDAPALMMTRLLQARAFASGRDIFFSAGRYNPGTRDGDHLLAHELAHTLQQGAVPLREDATAQRVQDEEQILVRPESLKAIDIARGHIGRINSTLHGADGNRIGWERLQEIFRVAFGGDVIAPALIKRIITNPDQLPHWCGIFAWHALRKAGLPLPPWKPGANMLGNTAQRPYGELPRKGDIAYRIYALGKAKISANAVHHQALVTGVESSAEAAGKDFKAIRVRTVDGNTAGSDNLGGQVEEKWLPIGAWDAFFDPTAKLDLPGVELVATDRTPDDGEAVDAEPDTASVAAQTSEEAVAPEEALPPPVAETQALDTAAPAEVAVELPPAPEVAPEPAATVETLALAGSSEDAMTAFVDASPSRMAATAPQLGPALDNKTRAEKRDLAHQAPVLTARTGGAVDPGITAPDQLPVPADVTLRDEGTGPEVGELRPEPHEETGSAPSTQQTRDDIQRQSSGGGFLDWFRSQFNTILSSLKTRDDSVNTSAGARQRVALSGEADVGRMDQQREDGTGTLRQQRDARVAAFRSHPGQSNIQPRQVDEARPVRVSPETAEPIEALPPDEGVADFVTAELPKNVRDAADAKLAPDLHSGLAEARAKTTDAARTRDADKAAGIADAERKTAAANRRADDRQRQAVLAGRGDVARQQGAAIGDAYDSVAEFAGDAGKRENEDRRRIRDDVRIEEGKAVKALEAGEGEARRIKREKEAEAAAKKAELKRKKEKEGLLERAAGFVKDVVNAITTAIDAIFNALRRLVKQAIEAAKKAAVTFINAARRAVIDKLNAFRDWAKDKVNTYLKDRFPGLAKALNRGIDATVDVAVAAVNAAADGAIAAVEAIADFLAKALDRILAAFQAALKAAVRIAGAVLRGDLAGALRIAIEAACEIAGVDPKPVFDFLERAGQQLRAILKAPGRFINNLVRAVGDGVRQFVANFTQHFKSGVIEWLTGALSAVPITLPTTWDIKGFFSLVAQILGLTYENIKSRVIRRFPRAAAVFDAVEAGFGYLRMLVTGDFSGLWEELKAKLGDLKASIIGAIRNWSLVNIVKAGVVWLLSLLNPASALVRAVKLLADLIFWLMDNLKRIATFIRSIFDAVAKIAAGVLAPAAKAIEGALARSLPVVISFLASAIGLGGIGEALRGVIQKLTAPINRMIDALIDRIVAFAKKLWGRTRAGAKAVGAKVRDFLWPRKGFSAGDEKHELEFRKSGAGHTLHIRSTPRKIETFLDAVQRDYGASFTATEQKHYDLARQLLRRPKGIKALEAKINARLARGETVSPQRKQQMAALQDELARHLRIMMEGRGMFAKAEAKYKLEGFVATYRNMPRATKDRMTPDHQPQAAALKHLARQVPAFGGAAGASMRERGGTSASDHARGGWTINLHHNRHVQGRTYGDKGGATAAAFRARIKGIPTSLPPQDQRRQAIRILKGELDKDVATMNGVYRRPFTDRVWDDLNAYDAGGNKKKLAAKIRRQVMRGQDQIKAQPMAELAG